MCCIDSPNIAEFILTLRYFLNIFYISSYRIWWTVIRDIVRMTPLLLRLWYKLRRHMVFCKLYFFLLSETERDAGNYFLVILVWKIHYVLFIIGLLISCLEKSTKLLISVLWLSLIHIWRCRRYSLCRSRWSPYH